MFSLPLPLRDSSLLLTPPWSSFHPAVQVLLLALVCLVPLFLLVLLYRYEMQIVPRLTALTLLTLRVTVLALVLSLVCLQPVYARDRSYDLPGRVLVVVDRSESMAVTDPQREPADKLRLVRALGLAQDQVPDALLREWITDLDARKEIRFLTAEEQKLQATPAPAGGARSLESERRGAYESLLSRADGLTRTETARKVLEAGGLLAALKARDHRVELMGFHRETWDVPGGDLDELFKASADPAAVEPGRAGSDQDAARFTDLRLPLVRALERSAGQAGSAGGKVLGVVLLTDGQHNSGEPPSTKARELGERGVPVFPVALGGRKPPPDVALVAVRGPNHTLFKDVDAAIEVRFKVTGLKAQDFIVELQRVAEGGKEKKLLAQKTMTHDGKDREYTETFPVRMDEVGTQTLLATVRPVNPDAKESRPDNNQLATTVSVADDKARVLIVDGEARWELHYLQTALARDRSIEMDVVVFDRPVIDDRLNAADLQRLGVPKSQLPAGPDALAPYQCIIFGDVDPTRLGLAERQRLERYVADAGGTLVVLAGKRYMPLAYPEAGPGGEADPLRKLLPIEGAKGLTAPGGFPLALAQGGREMKFLELDPEREENDGLWAGRPRPWGWGVVGRAKPGATPLAFVPGGEGKAVGDREKAQAVLARHNYGFGRVLFVGLDSTWRWRYKVGDLYHHRFWGQAIRWAAADKPLVVGNQYLRFGTPQPTYRQGEAVDVVTRLTDQAGPIKPDLLAGARIVRLPDDAPGAQGPGGKEKAVALVPLAARAAQPRVLEGQVRDLPAGRYAVELVIPDLGDKLNAPAEAGGVSKPLRAGFTVRPAESREMIDLETRWPLLEDLAAKSGGQVFAPEDAAALAEKVAARAVRQVEHHEQKVFQWWPPLVLVVGLLSLEWVLRKFAGLP